MRDDRELDPVVSAPEMFMSIARLAAMRSKDPRTKCGACIVFRGRSIGVGYNGFTPGMPDFPEIWETELKYDRVEHAERNAIHNADRLQLAIAAANMSSRNIKNEQSLGLEAAEMYIWTTKRYLPCPECAKAIAFNGISTVWVDFDPTSVLSNSKYDWTATLDIFKYAGVSIKMAPGDINLIFKEMPHEKSIDYGDSGAGRDVSDGAPPTA